MVVRQCKLEQVREMTSKVKKQPGMKKSRSKFSTIRSPASGSYIDIESQRLQDFNLEDVLANKHPEPFSKKNFQVYLKDQYAEENFEFYEKVTEYHAAVEAVGVEGDVEIEEEAVAKVYELQEQIVVGYVSTEAEKQVNISSDLREKTLSESHKAKIAGSLKMDTFDEALNEVKYLMRSGPFPSFISEAKTQNISSKRGLSFVVQGKVYIFIGVLITALFIAIAAVTENDVLKNPLFRLLALPSYGYGFYCYFTGKIKVCPFLAMRDFYSGCPNDNLLGVVLRSKRVCTMGHTIEDKDLARYLRRKGSVTAFSMVSAALIFTAIGIIIPPSYFY